MIYSWDSRWFATKDFPKLLREDVKIKTFLRTKLKEASVDRIMIERTSRALTITITTAKPGVIIGRAGTGIEDLKKQLRTLVGHGKKDDKFGVNLNVVEVSNPSLASNIVIQSMIADIEKRMPFRRVLKQHLDRVQKAGAKGVKLQIKGRLNGAEIARDEKLAWGSVPLHNLRADIDYASDFARTAYGTIGIKVWIYRGEIFEKDRDQEARRAVEAAVAPRAAARSAAPRSPAAPRAAAKPKA